MDKIPNEKIVKRALRIALNYVPEKIYGQGESFNNADYTILKLACNEYGMEINREHYDELELKKSIRKLKRKFSPKK